MNILFCPNKYQPQRHPYNQFKLMNPAKMGQLLQVANTAYSSLHHKLKNIEGAKRIDQTLNQIQFSLHEINNISSQVEWKQDIQSAKMEDCVKIENDSQIKVKIETDGQDLQNQDPSYSSSTDKKLRGPYRQYTEKLKQNVIQLSQRGLSFSRISRALGIPCKNIVRWCKMGPRRKSGAGRKVLDPQMESKLYEWMKDKKEKKTLLTPLQIRLKAKELSKVDQFEASPGWLKNFQRRHGLKNLYQSGS